MQPARAQRSASPSPSVHGVTEPSGYKIKIPQKPKPHGRAIQIVERPLHKKRRGQPVWAQRSASPSPSCHGITKHSKYKIKISLKPKLQERAAKVVDRVQAVQASFSPVWHEQQGWLVVCEGLPIGSSQEQQIAAVKAILEDRVIWEKFIDLSFENEAARQVFAAATPRHVLNPVTRQLQKGLLEDIEELEQSRLSLRKRRKVSEIKLDVETIRALWGLQLSKGRHGWTTRGCFTDEEDYTWNQAANAAKTDDFVTKEPE